VDGGSGFRGSHRRNVFEVEIGKIWAADLRSIRRKLGGRENRKGVHRTVAADGGSKIREGQGDRFDCSRVDGKPPQLNEF
jgi:hypothetical protein